MPNVKFTQDLDQFRKDDIITCSKYHANTLLRANSKSCEVTNEKSNIDGKSLTERQGKEMKVKAEKLRKKAKELAESK